MTLSVYDVSGRLVRCLLDEDLERGGHSVSWDGLNRSGVPVSSGIHFYRLKTGKAAMTREMVLVRWQEAARHSAAGTLLLLRLDNHATAFPEVLCDGHQGFFGK